MQKQWRSYAELQLGRVTNPKILIPLSSSRDRPDSPLEVRVSLCNEGSIKADVAENGEVIIYFEGTPPEEYIPPQGPVNIQI